MRLATLSFLLVVIAGALAALSCRPEAHREATQAPRPAAFLGFDRNIYPGDEAMKSLRRDFAFTGFWLSPPPGEKTNTWIGKHELVRSLGYGFLALFRGRVEGELKNATAARNLGEADARTAALAAKREGFPANTVIFLDIEEGGRLSPAYHLYLQSWLLALKLQSYSGGFYCSGIPVREGSDGTIATADDIADSLPSTSKIFVMWVYNDACPPSPGCTFPAEPPTPKASGISSADVWQYAQSPRRMEFAAHCPPGYHTDGNCYAPGDTAHTWFLDVSTANSPDPSNGR